MTRTTLGGSIIAILLLAAGMSRAFADVVSETEVLDSGGQVAARGEAAVIPGDPSTDTATSGAVADPSDTGPRSAFGGASLVGVTALPSIAGAKATAVGTSGTLVSRGSAEVAGGTGNAGASSAVNAIVPPSVLGSANADASITDVSGSAVVVTSLVFGDFSTEGGAATTNTNSLTTSAGALSFVSADEFSLSSAASSGPLAAGPALGAAALSLSREFLASPLLGDTTFSTSQIDAAPGSFLAQSESWKGGASGPALSFSSADTQTSQTLGTSSQKSDGVTNQSFSQALSAPVDGNPQFASAVAESSDGLSTYAASAVGNAVGLIDLTNDGVDNPAAPFAAATSAGVAAFDGKGIAHADALAGKTYAETDLKSTFDDTTLTGVAEGIVSVLSPTADVDSVVRVAGNGLTLDRMVSVGVDLAAVQTLGGTASAVAANHVVFSQTASGNSVIEGAGDRGALITAAGQNSRGLININQDVGNSNSQANLSAIAFTDQPDAVLINDVSGSVSSTGNSLIAGSGARSDVITAGSFAGGSGILGINQSSGSLNQLANALALAVGIGANTVAMGDVSLKSEHADNTRSDGGAGEGPREDRIDGGAFSGFSGIVEVNQVAGDLNQVTSVVSVSVSLQ